jgi:hypothetical protein
VAVLPDGSGGYVLDDWGGLHPFALPGGHQPPAATGGPYWPGQDVTRGVALLPSGTGGYVLDDWGGLHPFAIGANPLPPPFQGDAPYWPGRDVTRGISIEPVWPGGLSPATTANAGQPSRDRGRATTFPTPAGRPSILSPVSP